MPSFIFNKLVRDNLIEEYKAMGQVAKYRQLGSAEASEALKQKLIEEVKEIDLAERQSIVNEVADIYQVIEDLLIQQSIDNQEVLEAKLIKSKKKGGFEKAYFVESLSLNEDDAWVDYYREQPDVFKEINASKGSLK